jgi:hypothetical protein
MEPEGLLLFLQEPVVGPHPEPDESSPYIYIFFFYINFNVISRICLGPISGYITLGFPTTT